MPQGTKMTPAMTVSEAITQLESMPSDPLEKALREHLRTAFDKVPSESPAKKVILDQIEDIDNIPDPALRNMAEKLLVRGLLDILGNSPNAEDSAGWKLICNYEKLVRSAETSSPSEIVPDTLEQRYKALDKARGMKDWSRGGQWLSGIIAGGLAVSSLIGPARPARTPVAPTNSAIVQTPVVTGRTPLNKAQDLLFAVLFATSGALAINLGKMFKDEGSADEMAVKLVTMLDIRLGERLAELRKSGQTR